MNPSEGASYRPVDAQNWASKICPFCAHFEGLAALVTHADEEGKFKITGVHPGVYDVLARGRAGFNEAFWHADDVESGLQDITIAPGIVPAHPRIEVSGKLRDDRLRHTIATW